MIACKKRQRYNQFNRKTQQMNLKDTYNKIAAGWHEKHSSDDWWIEAMDTFTKALPEAGKVLDAGCGTGVKSKHLAGQGFRVTGVDFAEKMIEIAAQNVPEAEFKVWDLNEIDQFPEQFNGIFAQAVFLHFPKKKFLPILKKLLTRLKDGGVILISVKQKRPDGPEEANISQEQYGETIDRFFSFYTMDELVRNFENAGLKILYKKTVANDTWKNNWLTIIGKKLI